MAPTSSTTASLALGDALACALIEERHFKVSDFAKFHLGGSLGKHLSKVGDYMTTDNLPIVTPESLVSDTVIVISNGKHGLAVVAQDEKVVGVITDGDVRRAMQRDRARFFEMKVGEIMNGSPRTVRYTDRLSKAEKIMPDYKIYALIVVDENGKVRGVIDSISCL